MHSREELENIRRQQFLQLARDERFSSYMETIRSSRDAVIDDLCNEHVSSDERKTLAAIGELRVYTTLLRDFEQVVAQRQD